MDNKILIVDDDLNLLDSIAMLLRTSGFSNILKCSDPRNALDIIAKNSVNLILLDINMPYISGVDLLKNIRENHMDIPVIMLTAVNDVKTAVETIRVGAFDYMMKPVEEAHLLKQIENALEYYDLKDENQRLKHIFLSKKTEQPEAFNKIITKNPAMEAIFKYIEAIAQTPHPVLIIGETGTGKELIAEAIHKASGKKGNFTPVNVAGLDDTLFSDTLFGHTKGAFTGAQNVRKGLIEGAQEGTLFLDEIGDMEKVSQIKLLRLLQEKEYMPLGSDSPKKMNARVVVATNCDLYKMQVDGSFRKDLYYRLKTHMIVISPLRERIGDLELLIEHFINEASQTLALPKPPTYPKELIPLLKNYSFPGNIRELQGMIFDVVSKYRKGIIPVKAFHQYIDLLAVSDEIEDSSKVDISLNSKLFSQSTFPTLKKATEMLVQEALLRADGNQAVAAKLLGITRQALNQRLKK